IDAETGKDVRSFEVPARPLVVALSANGTGLAAITLDGTLTVWSTAAEKPHFSRPMKKGDETGIGISHTPSMLASFSSDGSVVAYSWDQTVRLLNARTGAEGPIYRGHDTVLTGLAIQPQGERVAAMALDGRVKEWDAWPVETPFLAAGSLRLTESCLSPDGRLLAGFVEVNKHRELWAVEVKTGRPGKPPRLPFALEEIAGSAAGLAFGPDGNQLAFVAGGTNGPNRKPDQVEVWDLRTGKQRVALPWANLRARAGRLVFSGDGDRLALSLVQAVATENETVVWDLRTGKAVRTLGGEGARQALASSPDGKRLAVGTERSATPFEVRLWDVDEGRLATTLECLHPARVLAFSPDGKRLAVAVWNSHEAELWDLEAGRRVQLLRGHLTNVVALAFSRDGRRLATTDFEGHARGWDALTGGD